MTGLFPFLAFFLTLFLTRPMIFGQEDAASSVLPEEAAGYDNVSFWQRESGSDWQPVSTDSLRNAILQEARRRRRQWEKFPPLDQEKRVELGIRRYDGRYVTFYTDMPENENLAGFVNVFDNAVEQLCNYFHLEVADHDLWHLDAFLMASREKFEKWGALTGAPDFQYGYSMRDRIWAVDQKYEYYNRFLLVHELVHSLMLEDFGALRPRWFSEGIAEYLALHRIENNQLSLGIIPDSLDEVPGFNRMGTIRKQVQTGKVPSLDRIFRFGPSDYRTTETYAWGWAFVWFLDHHSRYHALLERMPYYMMAPDPTGRFLARLPVERKILEADWSDFIASFDYRFPKKPVTIEYSAGQPLSGTESRTITVSAGKSWQSSGVQVEQGKTYRIRFAGQMELFDERKPVPSEAYGVTYQYINGRPRGALLLAVLTDAATSPWQEIQPVTAARTFRPNQSGTLYFKINDRMENLEKNRGELKVQIKGEQE